MIREILDYLIIKKSGGFDPAFYLLRYPDCRWADMDPLWHFVRYGWREGRNPSPDFDTAFYLEQYPDVKAANVNPLVHYIRYGRKEGRLPRADRKPMPIVSGKTNFLRNILYTVGIKIYWRIPGKYRQPLLHWLYAHLGFLFRGMPDYEGWRAARRFSASSFYSSGNLIDLSTVEPARRTQREYCGSSSHFLSGPGR